MAAENINEELRKSYWKVVSRTRQSGRISQSVVDRVEASWERFTPDVVEEALRIHRDRYAGYKETYTIGIMRNLQRDKDAGRPIRKQSAPSVWSGENLKRDYDYAALEEEILAN
ncbi:MAG: hypothetical protein HDR21_12230 [Lachnospiraceae bacterium]|nr:hypothetical protein [Lachnospiraceae bacterium]